MTHENWPAMGHAYGCRCGRCRRGEPLIERLANQTLSTALRHAQNRAEYELDVEGDLLEGDFSGGNLGFEVATGKGSITLPGEFGGWQPGITLAALFDTSTPPSTLFTKVHRTDFGLLYRVYEEYNADPLYIGMALTKPIRTRVASHFKGLLTKKNAVSRAPKIKSMGKGAATIHQHIAQMAAAAAVMPQQQLPSDPFKSEIEKLRVLAADPTLRGIKVSYGKVTAAPGYPLTAKFLHAYEAALQVKENPKSYVGSARTFEEVIEEIFEEAY